MQSALRRTLLASILLAAAPGALASDDGGARDDPTLRLIRAAIPALPEPWMQDRVADYTTVARAWWIQFRCRLLPAAGHQAFQADVAAATHGMRAFFVTELGTSPEDAQKHTETIQRYALNELSAARFLGCGAAARATLDAGVGLVASDTP